MRDVDGRIHQYIHTHRTRMRQGGQQSYSQPPLPPGKSLVLILQEAEWIPVPILTRRSEEKSPPLQHPGSNPGHPTRSHAPCRLAHIYMKRSEVNMINSTFGHFRVIKLARNLPFPGNIFLTSVSCPTRHGPAILLQTRYDILYIFKKIKTVSIMNLVKCKYHSILTNHHHKNLLVLATSPMNSNIE